MVDKIITTSQFDKGIKKLRKKNKFSVIKDIDLFIHKLQNMEVSTHRSNHPLKNADNLLDAHFDGGNVVLLYKYKSDKTLVITLELNNVLSHDKLDANGKRTNFVSKNKTSTYKEFEIDDSPLSLDDLTKKESVFDRIKLKIK